MVRRDDRRTVFHAAVGRRAATATIACAYAREGIAAAPEDR
jgi:hypothetical protein